MATLLVLYRHPSDPAAFDAHYAARHVPLAKRIPGLRSYEISSGPVGSPGGPSPYYLVATLGFDTLADVERGLKTPEGEAAAADLAHFADGGADFLMFETKAV